MKKTLLIAALTLSSFSSQAIELTERVRALNEGTRCGTLSIINSEDSQEFKALNIESIAIFTFFPGELSPVNGVITLVRQPRSSHISIKAKDWQIPNADVARVACAKENKDDMNKAFSTCFPTINVGDYVYFDVNKSNKTLVLEKTTKEDPRCKTEETTFEEVEIVSDLKYSKITDHKDLGWKDFNKVGSKAANYAELMKALNTEGSTPVRAGFAIPFYFYNQFIEENPIVKAEIASILSDEKLNDPKESIYRNERLEELQHIIMSKKVKINSSLLEAVLEKTEKMRSSDDTPIKLKFRSSTNAEDLPNFSGAGLYTSKSYKPMKNGKEKSKEKKIKSLVKAIKTVWASIWNKRAYDERSLYKIDHSQIYMGIQINPSFPDEIASGVIVTCNVEADCSKDATYIEAQRGDTYSVENPAPGVLPERLLVSKLNENYVINVLDRSTIDVDKETILNAPSAIPVLLESDITLMTELSERAEAYFKKAFSLNDDQFTLDIEFKVDLNKQGERTVFFKQARPYLIHN